MGSFSLSSMILGFQNSGIPRNTYWRLKWKGENNIFTGQKREKKKAETEVIKVVKLKPETNVFFSRTKWHEELKHDETAVQQLLLIVSAEHQSKFHAFHLPDSALYSSHKILFHTAAAAVATSRKSCPDLCWNSPSLHHCSPDDGSTGMAFSAHRNLSAVANALRRLPVGQATPASCFPVKGYGCR